MSIHRSKLLATLVFGVIALAGCDSDSDLAPQQPAPPPAPPPPETVSYTQFVVDQFAATADDTDPVSIEGTDFDFDSEDDPGAFDDLLSGN